MLQPSADNHDSPAPQGTGGIDGARHAASRASHLAELGAMAPLYAHEISNLLTHLSARAQLALMRPGDPGLREDALHAVGDCCRRIDMLTQIFLTPDAPSNDQSDHDRQPVSEIHRRVCATVRSEDRERFGLTLNDRSHGHAPDLMPVLLEQVLSNLIINALRAIDEHPNPDDPHHRIMIEAHALTTDQCSMWNTGAPGPGIEIMVEDTGAGMNPRQVSQLNSGQSVDIPIGPKRTLIARHGLGLRVCRKLLSTAGGSLRCDSSVNQGTRITLRVPAVRLDSQPKHAAA